MVQAVFSAPLSGIGLTEQNVAHYTTIQAGLVFTCESKLGETHFSKSNLGCHGDGPHFCDH